MAVTERISRRRHADLARGVEPGPHHDVGLNLHTPTPREPVRHPPNSEDARRGLRDDRLW